MVRQIRVGLQRRAYNRKVQPLFSAMDEANPNRQTSIGRERDVLSHADRVKGRVAKVGHKKSRHGCSKCKTRRVKCDESHPVCGNCRRLGLNCSYVHIPADSATGRTATSSRSPPSRARDQAAPIAPRTDGISDGGISLKLPESRERRLFELRFQRYWLLEFGPRLETTISQPWRSVWRGSLSHMALLNDGLLYSMHALSGTLLLLINGLDQNLIEQRNQYLTLACSELQSKITQISTGNASTMAMSSHIINLNVTIMIQERALEMYKPPLNWLHLSRVVGGVFRQAATLRASTVPPQDKLDMIMDADSPGLDYNEDLSDEFESILSHVSSTGDQWDEGNREPYRLVLKHIANLKKGIEDHVPIHAQSRAILLFAMSLPAAIVRFVEEERPRALVTLSYFFAVASRSPALDFLDSTRGLKISMEREVHAVSRVLHEEWQALMAWPLRQIEGGEISSTSNCMMIT